MVINFLDQFKKKLGESYIKTLQKPQEFKTYNVDIPKPIYTSTTDLDKKIQELFNKSK